MLAKSGEITAPCPVPLSLTATIPSSRMPAFSHFWIRRMMRSSPIRCSTKRVSHSLLTSSKKDRMSASDGNVLTQDSVDLLKQGALDGIDVIIGTVADERTALDGAP